MTCFESFLHSRCSKSTKVKTKTRISLRKVRQPAGFGKRKHSICAWSRPAGLVRQPRGNYRSKVNGMRKYEANTFPPSNVC